jgi:alpha-beta hydrolase superfamily lysophospholipase
MTPTYFTAADGTSIATYQWTTSAVSKGNIFIVHGLAEHALRYARTAQQLNGQGYNVYSCDLRGHGNSVKERTDLGYLADDDGWNKLVQDVIGVIQQLKNEDPNKPLILLGHSLGSFVVQQIIYERPRLAEAAIFSGSNGRPPKMAAAGRGIARAEKLRLGKRGKSQVINSMTFGKFNQAFPDAETPFDWLSRDPVEVKLYFNDSLCGFLCSTQLWIDFLDGITELSKPAHKSRIPKELPVYIFAGDKDPSCDNGRGSTNLANEYREAGLKNVTSKIYPEGRHEMLNETNRNEVISDLIAWMNQLN